MTQTVDIKELNEHIQRESAFVDIINMEMSKVIIGQKAMLEQMLIGLLSKGHILLEGVPGLAKTLAIKSLANIIHADFSRIQFTPICCGRLNRNYDLQPKKEEFMVKGPIFANFILSR